MEEKKNIKEFSKKEIEDGKFLAVLSYISILSLIPYFAEKKNKFVMYHAKQGINLFLLEVICSATLSIIGPILWIILWLISIVGSLVALASLALSIIGIVNVCNGEAKELPYINKFNLIK